MMKEVFCTATWWPASLPRVSMRRAVVSLKCFVRSDGRNIRDFKAAVDYARWDTEAFAEFVKSHESEIEAALNRPVVVPT